MVGEMADPVAGKIKGLSVFVHRFAQTKEHAALKWPFIATQTLLGDILGITSHVPHHFGLEKA